MQRVIRSLVLASSLLAAIAGCTTEDTAPKPASLDGTWTEQVQTRLPGVRSDTLELHSTGTSITGTGTYHMEAGPSGTLSITGSFVAPDLLLTITRDRGMVATYKAKLLDATHLSGSMDYEKFGTFDKVFVRQ